MLEVFRVNAVGPMIVSQVFLDLLREGRNPKIVNMTSQMGSLETKQEGGYYSYSSSKAALNMITRLLSFDVQPDGVIVAALHPGWVRTDMGGEHATLTPQESVRGLLEVINRLTADDSGKFYTWEGREHPW
jgi:NAD(P)-dependent dehydrogenase (short-subunit alcohol dehydrogenase family)